MRLETCAGCSCVLFVGVKESQDSVYIVISVKPYINTYTQWEPKQIIYHTAMHQVSHGQTYITFVMGVSRATYHDNAFP